MSQTPARPPRRSCLRTTLLLLLGGGGLAAVLVAGWIALALNWSYSEGDRAGYVQKFSKKGWVCKTWEGELAMANLPGAMPEIFTFSVRDDAVAARITERMGQRVSLHYEQHVGLPTTCFGETSYFVTEIRPAAP